MDASSCESPSRTSLSRAKTTHARKPQPRAQACAILNGQHVLQACSQLHSNMQKLLYFQV